MIQLKPLNTFTITIMLFFTFLILFFSGYLEFPLPSSSLEQQHQHNHHKQQRSVNSYSATYTVAKSMPEPFDNLFRAFRKWDSQVGCAQFRGKHEGFIRTESNVSASLQEIDGGVCGDLKMNHVSVLVKGWTWIPDNLDNLYSCRCGLSCLWTKSSVLADKPDALFFETTTPPRQVSFFIF